MNPSSKWFWIFLGLFLLDLVAFMIPIGSLFLLIGTFYPPLLRATAHAFLEYAGPEPKPSESGDASGMPPPPANPPAA